MKQLNLLAVSLAVLIAAGCSSTPYERSASGPGSDVRDGARVSALDAAAGRTGTLDPELTDPASPLYYKVIYFGYDDAEIPPKYLDRLRAHADYLVRNPGVSLRLEGHTDERGTRGYNLALGERRANSVKSFLTAEGVFEEQITVVSYGEERPAELGHEEEVWSLNRRVELVY